VVRAAPAAANCPAAAAAAADVHRETSTPRNGWQRIIHEQGLVFDIPGVGAAGAPRPYWDESVHYVFEMDEILAMEADVELLHTMCLDAVDYVVTNERYRDFGIAEWVWPAIEQSWRRGDPHIHGRFDLRYDGSRPVKLLEYNADTPTSLLEASVIQWFWKTDVFADDDQWNSIHEKLVARWAKIGSLLPSSELHFTWSGADRTGEDHVTVTYLQQTAAEAGLNTVGLAIEDIGWDQLLRRFVDLEEAPITTVVKLYPWEWVVEENFGRYAVDALPGTLWIEPLWKMLLSNKALLAVLWEMHPGHPNLLPAFLDQPGMLTEYVRKPKLGREGANIDIVAPGRETRTGGVYGKEGYVYQLFDPLPLFDGYRPALGAWVVDDEAAGLGIRETVGLVTDNGASFVPHRIRN
jgi:glutathionylspermidine synthase